MRHILYILALCLIVQNATAQEQDSLQQTQRTLSIDEVVVTGSHIATDRRLLPMTISVLDRTEIESDNRPSLLPTLVEQVPGLFITSRGVMGYGVSTGASGVIAQVEVVVLGQSLANLPQNGQSAVTRIKNAYGVHEGK